MIFESRYIYEVIFYSLVNMAPYIVLAFYIFNNRLRFSNVPTGILVGIVFALQIYTRWYGTTTDAVPVSITLTRLFSYFLFYLIAIRAHIGKKLFVLLIISNLSSLVSVGAYYIMSVFIPLDIHHTYCWHASLAMLLLHFIITAPFLYLLTKFAKPIIENVSAGKEWNYYWLIPAIFSFMWIYHIFGSSYEALDMIQNPKTLIFLLVIHASGMLVYYLVLKLSNQLQANLELERKNQLLDVEKIEYHTLQERIEATRRTRHDLRHHVLVMSDYLENGEYDSLKTYFEQFKKSIPEMGDFLFCDNRPVNRLVFFFATQARDNDIDFQVNLSLPSELSIPESDLSVLLGNLLENALDACLEQSQLQRKIIISGKGDKHTLYFTIDNSFENPIKKNRAGEFISTKKKGSGLGLQSVKHIVQKYNGVFTTEQKDNMFYASFMLNM